MMIFCETEEVKIGKNTFVVHELLATEFDEISDIEDSRQRGKLIIQKSANLTDEEFANLTQRARKAINDAVLRLNGWEQDFQKMEKTNQTEKLKDTNGSN